ncbi:erythroblast NAD(P)(+)--arginine ADP-ribosyltransferase-like [Sardina pilchardus]|uniref:erythroblast NAD(P)(+)--arginine ADP-ribosyltransferase-like n=1 Tax=Sardina pilchardus TaxID=27697 RepID=UPI002E0DD293
MTFAEFVLILTVALGQGYGAVAKEKVWPLDMAENSVDDQYDGCQEEMTHLVQDTYLEKELKKTANLKTAWREAEKYCDNNPGNHLTRNHCIAIYIYTYDEFQQRLYELFNNATRTGRGNYINMTYQWYSFHFLLTDALQHLTKTQESPILQVFRGTKLKFEENVENKKIRFGSFTSTSLSKEPAKKFGIKSCFEIMTCHGVEIKEYSSYPEQREVLIPPYETFSVTAVLTRTTNPSLWCDTVYVLNSAGVHSNMNCQVVNLSSQMYIVCLALLVTSACVTTFILLFFLIRKCKKTERAY